MSLAVKGPKGSHPLHNGRADAGMPDDRPVNRNRHDWGPE